MIKFKFDFFRGRNGSVVVVSNSPACFNYAPNLRFFDGGDDSPSHVDDTCTENIQNLHNILRLCSLAQYYYFRTRYPAQYYYFRTRCPSYLILSASPQIRK